MKRLFFTFREEPKDQVYYDLIDYALTTQRCRFVYLVKRHKDSLNDLGRQALESLHPFLIESIEVSEWPGTKLIGNHTVHLYKYDFCSDFANQLKLMSHRLYGWEHPALLED